VAGRSVVWVVSTTIGLIVAGFIFHFPGSFGDLSDWDLTAFVFGGIIGFVSGVVVGLVQWASLPLPRSAGLRLLAWIGVGIGITHALHDGAPNAFGLIAAVSLSGAAMGAGYAWSFGERRPTPVIVTGVAWAVALLATDTVSRWLGLPWEDTPVGWSTHHAIQGIIVGVIWGVATAVVGVPERLRHTPDPDPAPLDAASTVTTA